MSSTSAEVVTAEPKNEEMNTESSSQVDASRAPTQSDPAHHHHIFHQHHQTGKRVKQFFRPDGRKVHIASTPEEEQRMHRHLSVSEPKEFDLFIHGSPEHVCAQLPLHWLRNADIPSLKQFVNYTRTMKHAATVFVSSTRLYMTNLRT